MEAFSTPYPPYFQPSVNISRNHHRLPNHGGAGRPSSAMRLHTLQRITTDLNRSHRNPILKTTIHNLDLRFDLHFNSIMDDSGSKIEIRSGEDVKDTKEPEKKLPEIPPPPEKPLAGDCCGSGCVRCVWDVYYEELDEYNKLYKGQSGSTTIGSKVS